MVIREMDFAFLYNNIIEPELCCGCGTCVGICPLGSIEFNFDTEKPELVGKCNSCGICIKVCPIGS